MSDVVISAERLGKRYRIGAAEASYKTLRESIMGVAKAPLRWARRSARTAGATDDAETLWALRNVSFEVRQGEAVGIIGRNGAGKSTLLKVLSRITEPTEGAVELTGRVGSLLEVGTGFHPELTGRENIFLNGAILGMSQAEIRAKFDEIVAFAEVERFLDTPVKRYSSGMYTRLAFAVAAHLDPEILVVDEVLAVGDIEFQKKCIGKMGDVTRAGRTVLFVSHNMGAVTALCNRGILLSRGGVAYDGTADEAVRRYTMAPEANEGTHWEGDAGDEDLRLRRTWVRSVDGGTHLDVGGDVEVGFEAEVLQPIEGLIAGFTLWSQFGYELAYVLADDAEPPPAERILPGPFTRTFRIPANSLAAGGYRVEFDLGVHMQKLLVPQGTGALSFTMENITGAGRRYPTPALRGRVGLFRPAWFLQDQSECAPTRVALAAEADAVG